MLCYAMRCETSGTEARVDARAQLQARHERQTMRHRARRREDQQHAARRRRKPLGMRSVRGALKGEAAPADEQDQPTSQRLHSTAV